MCRRVGKVTRAGGPTVVPVAGAAAGLVGARLHAARSPARRARTSDGGRLGPRVRSRRALGALGALGTLGTLGARGAERAQRARRRRHRPHRGCAVAARQETDQEVQTYLESHPSGTLYFIRVHSCISSALTKRFQYELTNYRQV